MKPSTTPGAETNAAPDRADSTDEHPFRRLRDGWTRVARGEGTPRNPRNRVRSALEIALDPERSSWVWREAERTGTDAQAVVNALIDAARAGEH